MKAKTKRTLKRIGMFLLVAILGGAISAVAITAINGSEKELNPDNIIKAADYDLEDGADNGKGVKASVNEDGIIKLNGKATSDDEFVVCTVTLDPGEYVISGLDSKVDGVSLKAVASSQEYVSGITDKDHFVVESQTTYSIVITVKEGYFCFNKTVKPVLVEGDTAGEFYSK